MANIEICTEDLVSATYPEIISLSRKILETGVKVAKKKGEMKEKMSVGVWGDPGVGKSSACRDIAQAMGYPPKNHIIYCFSQLDPPEIKGSYFPDLKKWETVLLPTAQIKKMCAEPCFVVIEDANVGITKLHQVIMYQMVHDHRLGDWIFHEGTVIMLTGNLEENNGIVISLSDALNNRISHFLFKLSAKAWCSWAIKDGVAADVVAYIGFGGERALYNNTGEKAFPSPRSWAGAGRFPMDLPEGERIKLVGAKVGRASANDFKTYRDVYRSVNIGDILDRGKIPSLDEPSFCYAVVYGVTSHLQNHAIKKSQHGNFLSFLQELPKEFQVVAVKTLIETEAGSIILNKTDFREFRKFAMDLAKEIVA